MASFVSIALVMLLIVSIRAQGYGQAQLHINGAITCQGSAEGCNNFGTPSSPALSCQHVKDVCPEAASDFYYIESAGLYRKVFCEMDIESGGWARYGRSNQTAIWNYVDEDATEITLDIISPSEVKEMIDLKYNNFLVQTDVVFKMQADDSINPSRLTTRSLPWLVDTPLFIPDYGNDHTRIEFPSGSVDRVTCIPGSTSKCGQGGGLPPANGVSKPFFFQSLFFSPRGTGASLPSSVSGQWHRNKYTWNGSFYYVYAK
ncbi:uncharacterized protein LOC100892128 isoform X1 [Strongylocentrotus purpuratus]|uniref:Fibrinogen C-terminal domain-containing protein n=1 Tax=Strongylocentrotus purpuratus TaxID=7668 RepID=A0A7M7NE42_STRPU|nr:uncharacterized protein LOC100892128 isoform X1 [Strongylocentrotus purpuratus]